MIVCIDNVLTAEELATVTSKLETAEFVDGKLTAGWHARLVKHNTQLDANAQAAKTLKALVGEAIQRHPLFQMAVWPKQMRPVMFSRYEAGMSYGSHTDNAIMRDRQLMRSDVSLTLFLSDPATYEGGELVIEDTPQERSFKLEAGSMIVYPSSTLHRVESVTAGVRLVAVSWVQSLVRDPGERELLFELDTVRHSVFEKLGKSVEFDLLSKTHANLLRKWADL